MALPKPLHRLVPAKLTVPQPLTSWVPRERLLAMLGPGPTVPLTLVIAPAGFGKSTLAAQWLLQDGPGAGSPAVGWVTLDEHDQDGLHVLAYIAGAVELAAPGAAPTTLGLLGAAPLHVALQALLVDLSALDRDLTLVLDDYHLVAEASVHQAVAYLLRNLPPRCRMVIVSRADPPLPLARLRAERQLRELRAADLRFTVEETVALLTALGGAPPDDDLVAAVHQQTEGWALALQLAALAQLEQPAREQGLALASRQIAEYLADEVLARQPAAAQETLLALAVADRFCAGLLAALLGAPGDLPAAERRLDELARANLFLIPLDAERRWHRFHHLFRDLLLRRLHLARGASGVRALQRAAAAWFAAEGLMEEALGHSLAAGDEDAAAALVERLLPQEGTRSGSNGRLDYWLRQLPPALVSRLPGLALVRAHLAAVNLDLDGVATSLAHVDALLAERSPGAAAPPWPTFAADLAAVRGVLCYWQGRPEAAAALHGALEQPMMPTLAGRSLLFYGLAQAANGGPGADEGPDDGWPAAPSIPAAERQAYRRAGQCSMWLLAGEVERLAREAPRVAAVVDASPVSAALGAYVAFCLGAAAYERGDLDGAAAQFRAVAAGKYRINHTTYMNGVVGLALAALAGGDLAAAAEHAQEATLTAAQVGGAFLRHQALAVTARVALARGDGAAALRAAAAIGRDIHLGASLWLEAPRLTQAQALAVAGDAADRERAEAALAACLAELAPGRNRRLHARALAVRALLRQAQGRPADARADLERALAVAPAGLVRTFLDLGPALGPLLRAVPDAARRLDAAAPQSAARGAAPPARPALPELLTVREAEILGLLARRWSDKEIAEQLVIAPNTVRKHTGTIYQKLGVAGRRQAVAAAQALGLLRADGQGDG
jgi:LuxR family maltose regulon positive regulatory protein